MDKKSKVFLWIFFLLIIASVGVTYYRIMIQRDYVIEAQADCDPATEKCFVQECDAAAGEECTGDPEQDTTYFKKVTRNASKIPLCDPADETCKPWDCSEGEKDCTATLCDDATKDKEEVCNDPEQYNAEHPAEVSAEEATCEEGDESCLVTQGDSVSPCDPEQDSTCEQETVNDDSASDNTNEVSSNDQ